MKKPKILFIMQLPPPIHGASMVNLAITQSKEINNVFDLIVLPLNFVKKIDDIGKASFLKVWYFIKIIFKLLKLLITKRFDLVYFTISPIGYAFYRDVIFVAVLKLFRKKIVFHLHGKGIKDKSEKSRLDMFLYKFVFKNEHVITLSKRLNKDVEHVYSKEPLVLNNGITYLDIKKEFSVKTDLTVFVYLSNLVISKGIKVFLEAIVLTKSKGHNFKTKIIGNSADFSIEEIKDFVKQKELSDYVAVLGPKYGDEKYEELSTSDVFVFPTQNDCFPLSILEAMQMQLPVISTNQGAIPDIISHNINGLIVMENNVEDVSTAMIQYIDDKRLIVKHGANNLQKFKENFTHEKFEENFIKVINVILDENL